MIGGIVPEYMNEDWRLMRSHLKKSAKASKAAAEASTIEEATKYIGEASRSLIDADFTRLLMIKKMKKEKN